MPPIPPLPPGPKTLEFDRLYPPGAAGTSLAAVAAGGGVAVDRGSIQAETAAIEIDAASLSLAANPSEPSGPAGEVDCSAVAAEATLAADAAQGRIPVHSATCDRDAAAGHVQAHPLTGSPKPPVPPTPPASSSELDEIGNCRTRNSCRPTAGPAVAAVSAPRDVAEDRVVVECQLPAAI